MRNLLKQRRIIFSTALVVILSMFSLVSIQNAVAVDRKPVKNIIAGVGGGSCFSLLWSSFFAM